MMTPVVRSIDEKAATCTDNIGPWMLPGLQLSPLVEIFAGNVCGDGTAIPKQDPLQHFRALGDPLLRDPGLREFSDTPPRKRKRRPPLTSDACAACRRSKTRCSDEKPCSRCVRASKACIPWRHALETPTPSAEGAMEHAYGRHGAMSTRAASGVSTRACPECRLRKIRCDGTRPCSRCIKKGRTESCLARTRNDDDGIPGHAGTAGRDQSNLQGPTSAPFALFNGPELFTEQVQSLSTSLTALESSLAEMSSADGYEMSRYDEASNIGSFFLA